MTKYLVFFALVAVLPTAIIAIDQGCDYSQNLVPGTTYYVYNSEYPNNYNGARSCRWYARSTTKIRINCQIFSLPASTNCVRDRLAVSPAGNLNLADARNYCGTGTFNITSDSNSMNIVFTSYTGTTGGRFLCTLEAITPVNPTCNCGYKKQSKIVGGMNTGVNEYPMMAGIVSLADRQLLCGGTIIADRYVLSAAHCFIKLTADQTAVLVGEHDVTTGLDTSATRLIPALRIVIHPAFASGTQSNDIAVITTQTAIEFSMEVGPACLPFQYATTAFTGAKVTALGWGTLEFAGARPDILQKATLDVISVPTCQQTFSSVTYNQICTQTPGKDACQFDSGGPLLHQSPKSMRLFNVGIISYGQGCADSAPGVNTRVTSYLEWIVSVTPGANYCTAD